MCGIAGMINTVTGRARARVNLLNDAQTHRGPAVRLGRAGFLAQPDLPSNRNPCSHSPNFKPGSHGEEAALTPPRRRPARSRRR